MRVLHFYSTYYPDTFGGAEQAIFQICESTRELGVSPTVLALSKSPTPKTVRVGLHPVIRVKSDLEIASTRFSLRGLIEFADQAKKHDLVHFHFPWPFADLCQVLSRQKKPFLVTYHSDIVKQASLLRIYSPLMHQFLKRADALVATSGQYLNSSPVLSRYLPKTQVIPLALDFRKTEEPSTELLNAWHSRLPGKFFLFIGMLRYYKGLHLLVEAARRTGIEVVIAGAGPLEEDLKKRAAGLNNVRFVGRISDQDKAALLHLAYGFAFPSHMRSEAFGMSLLEASAAGLPLVTLEIRTGTSLINQAGITGLVVSEQEQTTLDSTIEGLSRALRTLWNSPELASRMGNAAKIRAKSDFDARLMGAKYAALYRAILDRRTA